MDCHQTISEIVGAMHHIAVVGASPNPWRESNRIMRYLIQEQFVVLPVNPMATQVLGCACVATLPDLPVAVDTVVCFRRSEQIEPIARDAVAIGARHLWMQSGIVNEAAREIAQRAGLLVVMNRCIMIEHRRITRDEAAQNS
jgi:uncharacterized protein